VPLGLTFTHKHGENLRPLNDHDVRMTLRCYAVRSGANLTPLKGKSRSTSSSWQKGLCIQVNNYMYQINKHVHTESF
jgi:hypothetical protein